MTLIPSIYLYPVVRGLILLWSTSILDSFLAKDNRNVFVRHGKHRREKYIPIPTLYARVFVTPDDHINDYLFWDTDGIRFVIDNSATAIIFSQHILFTGPMIPTPATLKTRRANHYNKSCWWKKTNWQGYQSSLVYNSLLCIWSKYPGKYFGCSSSWDILWW